MNGHWYVVASQFRVKIFTQSSESKQLDLLKTIYNPMGRERSRNLHGKKPGMGMKSSSRHGGFRHTENKGLTPHEQGAVQFSKKIAHYLERASEQKDFTELTVAAEPHFLGKLKTSMKAELKNHVIEWIKKDFQKLPDHGLASVLKIKCERRIAH